MNIKVIINPDLEEDITIECRERTPEIDQFVEAMQNLQLIGEVRGQTVPLKLAQICFFETENETVYAHYPQSSFKTRYRLYELENSLPASFMRVSKSTIVNTGLIAALDHKITSSRSIHFFDSHKIVYVSRMYFQPLKSYIKERDVR